MFIVVEGTDASGKSSLVEAIVSKLGSDVVEYHKGRPDELSREWVLNEYVLDIENRQYDAPHAVADRWHWGEVTYAPLKRPMTNTDGFGLLGVAGWRWTELFMASRGIAQFWLYQPLEVITSRLTSRGDDFVSTSELAEILSRYSTGAASTLGLAEKLEPRSGVEHIETLADHVINVASTVYSSAADLAQYPEYIGTPLPDVLLIGDKRNGPPTRTLLPFMPVNNNSGEYLMTALPEDLWRRVGVVNAGDIYGTRLVKLHQALGRPRIVCLGRMAEREVRSCGLHVENHAVLPHPQYVRRFHHHDKMEYGEAIKSFGTGTDTERYAHWVLP